MSRVVAVCQSGSHRFSKAPQLGIRLLAGLGVEGDAHCGATVQHRWQARRTPEAVNLRQVHLIAEELLLGLREKGFQVAPGELGENITTQGLDLLALPVGTRLHFGAEAVIELTGLRSPCSLIDKFQQGLRAAVAGAEGQPRAGVMAIVLAGGEVMAGDAIVVELPEQPYQPLRPV